MKREIICPKCIESIRELKNTMNKNPNIYKGEDLKVLVGSALMDFYCDHCNKVILNGHRCFAVTIFIEGTYYPWEYGYIQEN